MTAQSYIGIGMGSGHIASRHLGSRQDHIYDSNYSGCLIHFDRLADFSQADAAGPQLELAAASELKDTGLGATMARERPSELYR